MIGRGIISMALGCAAMAQPVHSETSIVGSDALAPCFSPSSTIDGTANALASAGWSVVVADEVLIKDIAWINAVEYMTGDSGGATLSDVLKLQRETARGLTSKKDIPVSKLRFMRNGDGDSLVLHWRSTDPRFDITTCRAALRSIAAPANTNTAFALVETVLTITSRADVTVINPDKTGNAAAPTVVIHTQTQSEKQ